MVDLVGLAKSSQDGGCLLSGGLIHLNNLKATAQSHVVFNGLSVLGGGRGTDATELTAT